MIESETLNLVGGAALKAAIILGIAGIVTITWRSASASAKHLIWTAGVVASLAIPPLTIAIARLDAPRIEVAAWTAPAIAIESPVTESSRGGKINAEQAMEPEPASIIQAPVSSVPSHDVVPEASIMESPVAPLPVPINWSATLLNVWLAGIALALLPLIVAMVRVRALERGARVVSSRRWHSLIESTPSIARLANRVMILESDDTAMPMTWGILRPTLLVPSNTERWADWQCRNILLHELAHIERRDCLTQLAAQIACAVYWFNPLAWIAASRMKVERELACDDRVISAGSRATDYASNLLDVARSLRAPALTSHTAIAMARPSQLSGRLLAVLDTRRNRRRVTRRIAAGTSFAAAAVVFPLASLTPAAAATTLAMEESSKITVSGEFNSPPVTNQNTAAIPFTTLPVSVVRAVQLPAVAILSPSTSQSLPESSPVAAKLATASLPPFVVQNEACWEGTKGSSNVSINTDSERGRRPSYSVKYTRDNCLLELRADGEFTLRPDLSDVETLGRDSWVRIEERIGRSSRRVEIRRADNGALEHTYWVDGDRTAWDSNGRAWLARTLLSVERRTAFAADTRVPQLYRSGGLRSVLSEISQMSSDYPKSKYYSALLDMGITLDNSTLNNIVRQVGSDTSLSDYYMSEVLSKFGTQSSADETTWRLFAEAAGRMKSDYYRSQTLKKVLAKGRLNPATVGTLLRSASGIKSDYYLTDLLKEVASKYAMNSDTRQFYVDALRNVESDYYRSELLKTMGSQGDWDARTTGFVLEAVASMKSDYYKSESLRALASAKNVDNWPAFFSATTTIDSDYYRKETLTTALRHAPLTRDIVLGVINSAARMKSDSEMSEVLSAVARSYKLDDSLRSAYERAVDAMDSDYYRGAALSALRRSMART